MVIHPVIAQPSKYNAIYRISVYRICSAQTQRKN